MALSPPRASFRTTITNEITDTATTIPIDSTTDDDGNSMDGLVLGFTIEKGTSKEEYVIGTVDAAGSRLTSVTRGISVADGQTSVAALKKGHKAKQSIEITSHPYLARIMRQLQGLDNLDSTLIPQYDAEPSFTSASNQLATVKFAEDAANAGAADASEVQKGISQEATLAQTIAGTAIGSTGARLYVNPAKLQEVLQQGGSVYIVEDGAGADDAYTGAATPTLASYTTGQVFRVNFTVANTGAATLDIDSVGVKSIKKYIDGVKADLETGDIVAGYIGVLEYDGTDFVLVSMSASAPSLADLAAAIAYVDAQPTPQVFTAGENLAQNDIVKLADLDGSDKLYTVKGVHGISTALSSVGNRKIVWIDDTTIIVATSVTSTTTLSVLAYTIDSVGAATLVDSINVTSFYSTATDIEIDGCRVNSTSAVFMSQDQGVVVQLSGGTLTQGGLSTADLVNASGRVFCIADNLIARVYNTFSGSVEIATYTISGTTISSPVDTDSTSGLPSTGGVFEQINGAPGLIVFAAVDTGPSPDAIDYCTFSVDGAGTISKTSAATLSLENTLGDIKLASYVGDTATFVYIRRKSGANEIISEYTLSGGTLTLVRSSGALTLFGDGEDIVYIGKNTILNVDSMELIRVSDLAEIAVPGGSSTLSDTAWWFRNGGIAKSTDGENWLLYSLTSNGLTYGAFDWLEAVGLVDAAVTAGNTRGVIIPFEKITTLTSKEGRRQYNINYDGTSSRNASSPFPIYRTIDATSAVIDDII